MMSASVTISYESESDRDEVRALLTAAFPTSAEADLVENLRADGDMLLALVARDASRIAGYIAFSQMRAPFVAVGLAPLAVRADRRNQGIAAALIDSGLSELHALGVEAVFVLGDPAYYSRFGFDAGAATGFECVYSGPYFMIRKLTLGRLPVTSGPVAYAKAFAALE